MELFPNQVYFTGYMPLPNGKSIKVFEQDATGNLIFSKPFVKLWFYLSNLGVFQNKGGYVTTDIDSPSTNESSLVGVDFITDPTSVAKLIIFDLLNENGPATNASFVIGILNEKLILTVRWEVVGDNDIDSVNPIRIGFYTSDNVGYNETGNLHLICGSKGPSLFRKTQGSFVCTGLDRIFVAIDRKVQVRLVITSRTPAVISFPLVTVDNPYTKFITVHEKCDKFRVGVYTLTVTNQSEKQIIKAPTPMFVQAAAIINAFLLATSLTLILFPAEPEVSILQQPPTSIYNNLPFVIYDAPRLTYSYATMATGNLPDDEGTDFYNWGRLSVKIVEPNVRSNPAYYPGVIWDIDVTNNSNVPQITPHIEAQHMVGGSFWLLHDELDFVTKQVIGPAIRDNYQPINQGQTLNVFGGFLLPFNAVDVNISVYFEGVSISQIGFVFNSITIGYSPEQVEPTSIITKNNYKVKTLAA